MSATSRARLRVLLAPVNIAGFLWEYAEGLREIGVEATVLTVGESGHRFPTNVVLKSGESRVVNAARASWWLSRAVSRYDAFHFDYGMTLLPRHLDLPVLRALGKRIVIQFMGSEARCGRFDRGTGYSDESVHCISCRGGRCMGAQREANVRALARWGDVFLGYPDMSYAALLPEKRRFTESFYLQAIDVADWVPQPPAISATVPRVLHAPSDPAVKGTSHVLAAVEALRGEGLRFEFQLLHGVPHHDVRRAMAEADIVVDQLLSATNGRLAIEAMALAKPVLCSLSDDYAATYPALPIVRTDPHRLMHDLRRLIKSPSMRNEVGLRGRHFVEQVCDRRKVAARLLRLYTSALPEVESRRDLLSS